MYARDSEHQEVYMEDLDVNDCSDDTFLPDFGGCLGLPIMATSGTKRKLNFEEDGFNDRLKRAARRSESEGSLTPVVKEELRCFIAAKRHSEGKQEIKVEFKEPVSHPLTSEEIEKKERRREQNRRAATKCRRKKKDAKIQKENEMKTLRDENENLSQQVRELQKTVRQYSELLREHQMSGQCALQKEDSISFIANIPTHIIDGNYSETPDVYSPRSPSSFFNSQADCAITTSTCSGYMQSFTGNTQMTPDIGELGVCQNFQMETPPVSPYVTEIPESVSAVLDDQLSDILRSVEANSLNSCHEF